MAKWQKVRLFRIFLHEFVFFSAFPAKAKVDAVLRISIKTVLSYGNINFCNNRRLLSFDIFCGMTNCDDILLLFVLQ